MTEKRRIIKGIVTSTQMDKTITVVTEHFEQHPIYKKRMAKRSKITAHDENNSCTVGDKVEVIESRPISKTKKFRVFRIVK